MGRLWFTFAETKSFFRQLAAGKPLIEALKSRRKFKSDVSEESNFNTLRFKDREHLPKELWGKSLRQLEKDERVNFDFLKEQLKFPVIRYLADKRQSKIQA